MNDHRMMTVKEIADYLHIATSTVYRLTKQRELPGLKVGGGWRFNISTIDEWRFKDDGKCSMDKCSRRL
jgi:excisionase family DNA binding protein